MHPYRDSKLPLQERMDDLVARMTVEEKAGLLFHAIANPGAEDGSAYDDDFGEDSQIGTLVTQKFLNHFNLAGPVKEPRRVAEWHNRLQSLARQTRLGIPVTLSSDPRHSFSSNPLTSWLAAGFSAWPEPAGLAAIRDPGVVERFGQIAAKEYRAIGIRSALHPMADLATEPRWARVSSTFGEDAQLASTLLRAYVHGFQGDELGPTSVATMVKHFPGGGPQQDGEDPHFSHGREQIYPGGNLDYHLEPFKAAFDAGAAQAMVYYGVPVGIGLEEVGFAFNRDVVTGILRDKLQYDGVVSTDWGVISDSNFGGALSPARAWGVEHLSRRDRVLRALEAGVDQFGGEDCAELVVELVNSGALSVERLDVSVRRILAVKFRLGLFDDPLVDVDAVPRLAGARSFVEAGLEAQRASLTLLKNQVVDDTPLLPLAKGTRVYLRGIEHAAGQDYATVVDDPLAADIAIVRLAAPYEPRTGVFESFLHSGSLAFPPETLDELIPLLQTLPAVVVVYLERPAILTEINQHAAALIGEYGASDRAVLDVLFGRARPKGRLPFGLPSSTEDVLAQRSDVPFDLPNPLYRFGDGLEYRQRRVRAVVTGSRIQSTESS